LRPAFDPALAGFSEKITLQTSWRKNYPAVESKLSRFRHGKRKNHCTDSMCVAGKTNA
jgi:hypothetical protein